MVAKVLTPEDSVGQWMVESPGRSRVFEKYGIDYCCGGKTALRVACDQRGIRAEAMMAELLSAAGANQTSEELVDPSRQTMTELADHIERVHHAWLKQELPRAGGLINRVLAAHGNRVSWLTELKTVFDRFAAEMDAHMFKEERILFPRIRSIDQGNDGNNDGYVDQPIAIMEHEHDRAGSDLEKMRSLTGGYTPPEGACGTFRAMLESLNRIEGDTHSHVHKENNILFPRAIAAARRS